jgi:hypothetical protein
MLNLTILHQEYLNYFLYENYWLIKINNIEYFNFKSILVIFIGIKNY